MVTLRIKQSSAEIVQLKSLFRRPPFPHMLAWVMGLHAQLVILIYQTEAENGRREKQHAPRIQNTS